MATTELDYIQVIAGRTRDAESSPSEIDNESTHTSTETDRSHTAAVMDTDKTI